MVFDHSARNATEFKGSFDVCSHCGGTILKGAMRCVSCGKILRTPEEQSVAIREMTKRRKGLTLKKLMKMAFVLIAAGAAYYYSDTIRELITALVNAAQK